MSLEILKKNKNSSVELVMILCQSVSLNAQFHDTQIFDKVSMV